MFISVSSFSAKKNALQSLLVWGVLSALMSVSAHADIALNIVNVPADGKVLFLMGQDTTTLRLYKSAVLTQPGSTMPVPGGVTLYSTAMPISLRPNTAPTDATLYISGMEGPPYDNSAGESIFAETLADYDSLANGKVAIAVGLYLSDSWAKCDNVPLRAIAGTGEPDVGSATDANSLTFQWRYALDRMIQNFKADGRPVYLRIGYEFDGPWNCYNQAHYKSAFRWIATRIKTLGATNIATVWQSAAYPYDGDAASGYQISPNPAQHLANWYPGDRYVDWVGISYFSGTQYLSYQWSCPDASRLGSIPNMSPRVLQDAVVAFASTHGKPVIIAESAPQGFNLKNRTYSCTTSTKNIVSFAAATEFAQGQAMWDAFFADFFGWIAANQTQIRAVAYINANWESQTSWQCALDIASCSAGYWGNSSIQENATVLENFATELKKPMYALAGGTFASVAPSSSVAASSAAAASSTAVSTSSIAKTPSGSGGGGGSISFTLICMLSLLGLIGLRLSKKE